jgi:hypothetical protein
VFDQQPTVAIRRRTWIFNPTVPGSFENSFTMVSDDACRPPLPGLAAASAGAASGTAPIAAGPRACDDLRLERSDIVQG